MVVALALARPAGPGRPAAVRARSPSLRLLVAIALGLTAVVVPSRLVPLVVLAGAGAGVLVLRSRRADARAAQVRAGRVLEVCEQLASELAAGLPPGRALVAAAGSWTELDPVLTAHRLGGSVPDALRVLARRPGAGDLRLLAAAWQVAHRSGAGLADALDGVAVSLRERQGLRRVVLSELSSARATARLMVALPVLTLLMGSGIGGDPVGFLLGQPAGWVCLAGGLALGLAGLAWIEALAGAVERRVT
ncbi:type II secretion system F family protein [Nocardioides guangzhouensis]|uniref:type II secretion system F family protein n=1 Tax=Nocardioides guangzhouensis TaxID=2497878 RepID=UPI0014386B49|nr:type II secretion system F family protein [Nocardioides guangzhouensis]